VQTSAALPEIAALHQRHFALTESLSRVYADAAAVCLARHHSAPTLFAITSEGETKDCVVTWSAPGERELAALANVDDATRDGAYGMVLAAAEMHLGLFAYHRAQTKTGADYYLSPTPADARSELNLEQATRLEISGLDRCREDALLYRLGRKVEQARLGRSSMPARAGVIGFQLRRIAFRVVTDVA
jgi:hypothetical protein